MKAGSLSHALSHNNKCMEHSACSTMQEDTHAQRVHIPGALRVSTRAFHAAACMLLHLASVYSTDTKYSRFKCATMTSKGGPYDRRWGVIEPW